MPLMFKSIQTIFVQGVAMGSGTEVKFKLFDYRMDTTIVMLTIVML